MTHNPANNAGPDASIPEGRHTMMALTDALPPLLGRLLRFAPFNYAAQPWWNDYEHLARFLTPEEIAARWVVKMRRRVGRAALAVYGPDHPQAQ